MSTQAQAKATIVRVPTADLPTGGQILVRSGSRQIAVFRLESGDLYAVDNQCPHEGYPLVKGTVKDCILTCPWHNYKFRLQDGACLMGDEAVRTFPVRELGGPDRGGSGGTLGRRADSSGGEEGWWS